MAKIQRELYGSFDEILNCIYDAATSSSTSSMIDSSDFKGEYSRCAVMVFERYSVVGQNRVSLSVTLFETEGRLFISAISSGGSLAIAIKLNKISESSFLESIRQIIDSFSHKK